MPDKYQSFTELSQFHTQGKDYEIETRKTNSRFAIMAPHGGYIEHATRQIASAIADDKHNYYCFRALYDHAKDLHVTSNSFNEPIALDMCASVQTVITVHGAYGKAPHIYFGGKDLELKYYLIKNLNEMNYPAALDPSPTRQGLGETNICNLGKSFKGVQIEITQGFRKSLFDAPDYTNLNWQENERFHEFCTAIRQALDSYVD